MTPESGQPLAMPPASTGDAFRTENRSSNAVLDAYLKKGGKTTGARARADRNTEQSRADLADTHSHARRRRKLTSQDLKALGEEYRSLTVTRGRQRNAGSAPTQVTSGLASQSLDNAEASGAPDVDKDEESDSSVGPPSDSDSSDDEFGTHDNPTMSLKDRTDYEALVFVGRENTTLKYKKAWEDAKSREDAEIRANRLKKFGLDMVAGAVNQVTSFGVAGVSATMAGNPWVFPIVAMLTSDLIGDRLAQIIRGSTMVADGTKAHFENQRRIARALGDLMRCCCGPEPKKKFKVKVIAPATGKAEDKLMSAGEALRHTGCIGGLSAWGQNLLVRGLPFLWFSAVYGPRDYYMNYRCPDSFYVGAPTPAWSNGTHADGCPDPESIDPVALRWSMVLLTGMMSGALTALSNQLLTSLCVHEERTNYSTDTYAEEVRYKESAIIDCKSYLDFIGTPKRNEKHIAKVIEGVETLKRILEKELRVARKKSSLWTTLQGELDLATQKHRDENMITPEFGGKRLELFMSMLGKLVSLLCFAYVSSRFVVRTSKDEQEKIMGLIFIPLSLIILGGYALRDDARLVGQLPYGAVKGAFRACKGRPETDGGNQPGDGTTTTGVPQVIIDNDPDSGESESEEPQSARRGARHEERVGSTSDTPARPKVSGSGTEDESVIV